MMKTYPLPCSANAGKLSQVAEILPLWRSAMTHVQLIQTRRLKSGVTKLGWLGGDDAKALPTYLSQRQWKSVVNQVNAALSSWQGTAVTRIREMIRDLDVSESMRHELNLINVCKAWWSCDTLLYTRKPRKGQSVGVGVYVSQEALGMMSHIITEYQRFRGGKFPTFGAIKTMNFDGPIATVQLPHSTPESGPEYWIKISTLTKGKPVSIPVHGYQYFHDAPGEVRNFAQVRVEDGVVSFSLVKESEPVENTAPESMIGLDWGLVSMLTSSEGDVLGKSIYPWLKDRDKELMDLTAALQASGIKPSRSKRYRRLNRRISAFVKNETNRILNRLAARGYNHFVVEKLDFRGGGLSRKLNRIMSRAGRGAVSAKLKSLQAENKAVYSEVNPAYTSRTCSGCGYQSKTNRKSQARFKCGFCSKTSPADINAARNIVQRRSLSDDGLVYARKESISALIDDIFSEDWNYSAAIHRAQQLRGSSTAMPGSSDSALTRPMG